ncbi:MAG: TRAP transporter fused permease subunit [Proteobacteria bacterium]|jgi:TRAP transporter 4TM/12TM fusion protein|nr:TRAP transporter fused permease subunit [Pseudomonadota bacterium]
MNSSKADSAIKVMRVLAFALVVIGMLNTIPTIPGLDKLVWFLSGNPEFVYRRFSYEYFFPLIFLLMMVIVALNHSFWREYKNKGNVKKYLGILIDVSLVSMAALISISYFIEIDSICLLDQFTGERAELIARSLKEGKEFAALYGLPEPNTVDDPTCINTLGNWLFAIVIVSLFIFLIYNIKVWGIPLVSVVIILVLYALITSLIWYFWGSEDINKYFITKLGGEPRLLSDARPAVKEILISNGQGLLGRFMNILINTVFPYIILGSLFGVSAGGKSLIKLAFRSTRKLRGGPAHAAIVSSAMFGTISGGPIVNVLSTGALTIPMMLKRGFAKVFAGGIEASASSGGQIMPPVMGVAAFILSAMTVVPYKQVILAAVIPAVAYFFCLFLSVVFQSRKQDIKAVGKLEEDMILSGEDYKNLIMVFAPILLILFLLITPKDAIGCGPIGSLFGVTQIIENGFCRASDLPWLFRLIQNSAGDAGSAGWWATALLMVLFFLDKHIRKNPSKLIRALCDAGTLISSLYLMFFAVSVIDFTLNLTGLSNFLATDIIHTLRGYGSDFSENKLFLFISLLVTMIMAIILGMGMPSVPAYINVALLMGPMLVGLGIATFTAHMFIFYFAVASAITPPVAVAAFAAASITKADPMATGFSAVKSGIVMFIIPFVFAFYPELLIIEAAQIDPNSSSRGYLPGYDGEFHLSQMLWLFTRTILFLYLIASALARFDKFRMSNWEVAARLVVAILVISQPISTYTIGITLSLILLIWHYRFSSLSKIEATI